MVNARDKLYRLILSCSGDKLLVAIAIMQSQRIEESSDARCRTAPDGLTKGGCKRLIKMIRAKQSCADVQVQQTGQRAIEHIRNVWIPQIMQAKANDAKAD